jgi:hypothetical protein
MSGGAKRIRGSLKLTRTLLSYESHLQTVIKTVKNTTANHKTTTTGRVRIIELTYSACVYQTAYK